MTEKLIECDCGWTCRGTDEHLIAECTMHAREVHGMELTSEQILALQVAQISTGAGGQFHPAPTLACRQNGQARSPYRRP